ncbi:MAG TPA: hypothetical protein VM101_10785, partial [Flavitalea sp.]|nr:hypothetical protein [Flavitalea sp.]
PFFIHIDGKNISEPKSAEWCLKAVEQCWKMKEPAIKAEEKVAAKAAYDKAHKLYADLMNGRF